MPGTAQDFETGMNEYRKQLYKRSRAAGPSYCGDGKSKPTIWHDQKFASGIEPVGIVNCPQALSVGRTLSNLEVVLIASASNDNPVQISSGSTITFSFMQGDAEQGVFEDVGPTICIKAPLAGKTVKPGEVIARVTVGDFARGWLMVNLEFSGAITGGTADCILAFHPHY